jgi:hypothetical protein
LTSRARNLTLSSIGTAEGTGIRAGQRKVSRKTFLSASITSWVTGFLLRAGRAASCVKRKPAQAGTAAQFLVVARPARS